MQLGTETRSTVAPAASSAPAAAARPRPAPRVDAVDVGELRRRRRRAGPATSAPPSSGAGASADRRASPCGRGPRSSRAAARRRRRSSANGPIWSRLDANAIRPYRLTRPYVGFTPDHAAQRGGLADRAAGVGAERRAARTRRRPPPPIRRSTRRRPARGRAGCGSAPNAEFSVDEPIANSSRFVLPIGIAAGVEHVLRRPWPCTAAASRRGSSTSRWSGCPGCRGCP